MITSHYQGTQVAFYAVPKCGKTSVKLIMGHIRKAGGVNHNYGDHIMSPMMRWRGRDHYRFTVVRDPVKRLLSAYNDRVGDRDDIRRSSISTALCKVLHLNPSPGPDEFILNLKKYAAINDRIFRHVIPQVWYTGSNTDFYDAIYTTSEINRLTDDLNALLQLDIPAQQHNASKSNVTVNDISAEALAYAKAFYKRDYEILGKYFQS